MKLRQIKLTYALTSLLLCACASTAPVRRVHTAAGMPRTAVFLTDREETHLEGKVGMNYGASWTDSGNAQSSANLLIGGALQIKNLQVGWTPFYSRSFVNVDQASNWGSQYHLAYRFGNGSWRYTPQLIYGVSINHFEDSGCEKTKFSLFGDTCDPSSPIASAQSKIKINEPGLSLAIERNMGKSFWAIVPQAYYTSISASNNFTNRSTEDLNHGTRNWNYALLLFYGGRNEISLWSIGLGASTSKEFLIERRRTHILPVADIRYQF